MVNLPHMYIYTYLYLLNVLVSITLVIVALVSMYASIHNALAVAPGHTYANQ